jgi:hypothetical protein
MSYDPNAPGPPPEQHPGSVAMPPGHTEQHYQQPAPHYQQPGYPPQYAPQQHQQGGGGPSFGVMAPRGRPGVHVYPFWQRSEFLVFLLTAIAIGIACAVADTFDSTLAWTLITVLAASYVLSRGMAKREPRGDDHDKPWEPGSGGSGRR